MKQRCVGRMKPTDDEPLIWIDVDQRMRPDDDGALWWDDLIP